jgi:3-phenylpropionate/trans-cinnamate dioxygenase ferredoxin reductase subunit
MAGDPTTDSRIGSSADSTILVVGAGQAGISLVTALRELGDDSPIVLVGEEPEPPYERPPLSKSYLRGEHDRDTLVFRPPSWFAEQGVQLLTGRRVVDVARHRDGEAGGTATTDDGREIAWHRLALTTGATNRTLPVEGADLDRVLSLRTLADADALAPALRAARSVVVVGGGFIGLEVAASARALGAAVTVVEVADRLLARAVTPQLSAFYLEAHTRRGTRIHLGSRATRIHGTGGRAEAVVLDDGTELEADLVVVGTGVEPRTDLARRLGLDVEPRGIVVDRYARASDGLTVAAGDCTVGPNPFPRGISGPTRLESVPHATDQARAAAATLAGRLDAYDDVPWFWSDQADLRLQIAGLPQGADTTVVRGDVAAESFSLLSYRDGLLVAIEAVNASSDYLAVKRALEKGMTLPVEAAVDVTAPLKRAISPVPGPANHEAS